MIIKYLALASVFIAGAVLSAPAASPAEATWPSAACAADMAKLCPGLEARGDAARGCRREHRDAFSPGCRADMRTHRKAMMDKVRAACGPEITKFCAGDEGPGEGAGRCLRDHATELSSTCKAALPRHRD